MADEHKVKELSEIAEKLCNDENIRGSSLAKKLGLEKVLEKLKTGEIIVRIDGNGKIRSFSPLGKRLLEYDDNGKLVGYPMGAAYFAHYVPIIEDNEIKHYFHVC